MAKRLEKLSPGTLVLLGKGIYQQVANRADAEAKRSKDTSNKRKKK